MKEWKKKITIIIRLFKKKKNYFSLIDSNHSKHINKIKNQSKYLFSEMIFEHLKSQLARLEFALNVLLFV